jgi:hypothetical protein
MLPSKVGLRPKRGGIALRVSAVVGVSVLSCGRAEAAEYAVKSDGSGQFTSIQACANAAHAGDTCVVHTGVYNEHVQTAAGGSSESVRLTFRTEGVAIVQGFDIKHAYVTVQGFDITGYTTKYTGQITAYAGGDHCRILDNTIRDGAVDVYGIYFIITGGQAADNCVVRGNKLSNLNGNFITTAGDNHLIESNTLEIQNNRDYIRLFGSGHVFRRNVFWRGSSSAGTGNHPDVVQNFGGADLKSENHVFEENWIQDLPSQFSQMNSGDGVVSKGILYDNVKNILFRRNVIVNVSMNANIGMPGVRFENNTFYRMAYELSGLGYGGSLTRGFPSEGVLKNNVFLAGGSRATITGDSSGFYSMTGQVMSREVIGVFVTSDPASQSSSTLGIYDSLRNNGYIDPNGKILAKAVALSDLSQFVLDVQYDAYKPATYDTLIRSVRLDQTVRSTFLADYNFVAGAASVGFPAKRSSGCVAGLTFTDFNFCEAHGINGGDPRLANLANVLGPDGLPFTLDDGLKPLPTSPLCGRGEGGVDIGAYSCDPGKVFPPPAAPTGLRIVR